MRLLFQPLAQQILVVVEVLEEISRITLPLVVLVS
jgi:hypothetical protein